MTKKEIKNELEYNILYKKQSNKPEWWDVASEIGIVACATMGSNPFNEWYGFKDRATAVDWIADVFDSQSFIDNFTFLDGEFYHTEDLIFDDEEERFKFPEDEITKVADLQSLVEAESRF